MLRLAVVGAGSWGINHVRAFAAERDCEVAWVCDPDESARDRARALVPRARVGPDLDEALADSRIAAVVIATPSVTHAGLGLRALESRKHVLIEKPFALDVGDAQRLEAVGAKVGRVVCVGHLMVYHPAVVELRRMLRSGELGQLRYLHATRVNLGRVRRDENVLWSLGPHDLSILDHLLGELPAAVAAHGAAYLEPGVEDVVFVTLWFGGGVIAQLRLSRLDLHKERRFTVVGSAKMAELDDVSVEKLRVFDRGLDQPREFTQYGEYLTIRDGAAHVPPLRMEEPLRVMARHFADCCRSDTRPITDAGSGVRIARILAAAQESLSNRGIVVGIRPA